MEKFQISVKNLNNLWSFIEIYAVFVLNLCGEKSVWRKSVWRKNDKYEVWESVHCTDKETGNEMREENKKSTRRLDGTKS